MMMKDPKTGKLYDIDLRDPKQSEEAQKMGLVYACMHYFSPEEIGGDAPMNFEDIKAFWKQAAGIDLPDPKKDE